MRRLLVATTNQGKLREIQELLGGTPAVLVSLSDLPAVDPPEETGVTFAENARLKALAYAQLTNELTVAEDSGLVIDGLDGEPGVHSARFLRPDATYPERFDEIARRLAGRPEAARRARFICALALADARSVLFETAGVVQGTILDRPRGTGGFGYDPIFFHAPYGRTLAEVSQAEKLAVAHRGQAFRAFAAWLSSSHLMDE